MIYLIGGPPKCGKTTFSKQLSKSFQIPWVSTDTLQNVVKSYIPLTDYGLLFPASSMRYKYNDDKYSKKSSSETRKSFRKQAKTVYGAIEAFIDSEIADGNDYIIEGYHVEPAIIDKLRQKYPEKVRSLILIKKDSDVFIDNLRKSSTPNDWILARTRNEQTFKKIAEMVAKYSQYLEDEAKKLSVKVICVDVDFEDQLKAAERYFADHIL